jgi:hypothetical protein
MRWNKHAWPATRSSREARAKGGEPDFHEWNPLTTWLRQVERLRHAA